MVTFIMSITQNSQLQNLTNPVLQACWFSEDQRHSGAFPGLEWGEWGQVYF